MDLKDYDHHSAGGIIYTRGPEGIKFLLIKQVRKGGVIQWTMPKGHLDPGETTEQAALREVWEEVGLVDFESMKLIGDQSYQFTADGVEYHKIVTWYLMEASHEEVQLEYAEGFVEAKWLPYQQARELCTHDSFRPWIDTAFKMI